MISKSSSQYGGQETGGLLAAIYGAVEEQIKKQAGQHALPADEVTVKADAKGVIHKIELHLETEETSKVTKAALRQFKNQLCSQYKLQKEQVEIWI